MNDEDLMAALEQMDPGAPKKAPKVDPREQLAKQIATLKGEAV